MPSRRQFLLGSAGLAVGSLVLPAGTAHASTGAEQSPIDIRTSRVVSRRDSPTLFVDYPRHVDLEFEYVSKDGPAGCGVRREDETIEALGFSRDAHVYWEGDRYRLLQFHFHTRSEHTVDGHRWPLEQHFVHERVTDGKLLVVGVFLERGGSSPQDRVLARLPQECGHALHVSDVDLRGMLPADLTSYRYPGSLTTPGYAEGVNWHVMRRDVRIARGSVDRVQALFPQGNARGVQPLNGRTVQLTPGRRA